MVARTDAKLVGVVERLSAEGGKSPLGAAGYAVHAADHVAGAIENGRDVMPLSIVHELSVAGENVDGVDVGFVKDGADCTVAGDAQAPAVRVRAAHKSHFSNHHAGVGRVNPCGYSPIARAYVEACSGGAACGAVRDKGIAVGTIKREAGVGPTGGVSRSDDACRMVVSRRIESGCSSAFVKGPERNRVGGHLPERSQSEAEQANRCGSCEDKTGGAERPRTNQRHWSIVSLNVKRFQCRA